MAKCISQLCRNRCKFTPMFYRICSLFQCLGGFCFYLFLSSIAAWSKHLTCLAHAFPHVSRYGVCQIPRECSVSPHYITLTTSVYDFPPCAALQQWHHLPEDFSIHTHSHTQRMHQVLHTSRIVFLTPVPGSLPALHILDYLTHPFQDKELGAFD